MKSNTMAIEFVFVGTEWQPGHVPFDLLARQADDGLVYAGSAFAGLGKAERDVFWTRAEHLSADKPASHNR